jgi:hypothetical protein
VETILSPAPGLLIASLLAAVTALAPPALLRIRGLAWFALATLVCGSAWIVLLFIGLSLVDALNQPAYFAAHAVLAAALAALWWLRGHPLPELPARPRWSEVRAAAAAAPVTAALAIAAGAALLFQLYVAIRVAPNTYDSMTYHLAKVGYWLTHETAVPLEDMTVRQSASPPNAEFLQGWTMLASATDRVASTVQTVALAGIATAIFAAARFLGCTRAAALGAASIFVLLPQPLLQATSTQNDLVAAVFFACAALFLARGLRDRAVPDLVVGGAALGLAIGTKGTAVIALPSLGLLLAAAAVAYRPPARVLALGAGSVAAGAVLLGSFIYVRNLVETDSISGGIREQTPRNDPIPANLLRNSWSFVDAPGTPMGWADFALTRSAHKVFDDLGGFAFTLDTAVSEDTSGFGLAGMLLVLPLVLVTAFRRRAPPGMRLLAIAALLYLVLFSIVYGNNDWVARVLMPMVVLAAPLLARLRPATLAVAGVLAVVSAMPVLLVNPAKPVLVAEGEQNVFPKPRIGQQTLQKQKDVYDDTNAAIYAFLGRFPGEHRLAYVGGEDSWVYPYFGRHFDKVLTPMDPEEVTAERLREEGLEAALFVNLEPRGLSNELLAPGHFIARPRPGQRFEPY